MSAHGGLANAEVTTHEQDGAIAAPEPRQRRQRYRSPRGPDSGRTKRFVGSIKDLDHAIGELERAKGELAAIPEGIGKAERRVRLREPLDRLALVGRYCAALQARHGDR